MHNAEVIAQALLKVLAREYVRDIALGAKLICDAGDMLPGEQDGFVTSGSFWQAWTEAKTEALHEARVVAQRLRERSFKNRLEQAVREVTERESGS